MRFRNRTCTFTEIFTPNLDFQQRVDLAYKYMLDERTPANLIMLYFEQPDDMAHKHGPNSEQVSLNCKNGPRLSTR